MADNRSHKINIHIAKRAFSLLKLYAKMDMNWFLRDTKYCLLNIFADLISNASSIAGVFLLSERFGGIGGMSSKQILFMLGYATMIDGLFLMLFGMGNVGFISRIAGRGQMDHMMIQPVSYRLQLLCSGFIPFSGSGTLICGTALTAYAAASLKITVTPLWILLLAVSLFASLAIILAMSNIIGSAAFYSPVAAEEISTTVVSLFDTLKVFPLGGLPYAAKIILCTVLPVGLAAWFPANVLLSRAPGGFPALLTILAAILLSAVASVTFRKGMKYYAKTGSVRYLDRGHRR